MYLVCQINIKIKVLCNARQRRDKHLSMNLITQEKNQHSNCRRPSGDPASVILQTSKSWRKMLRDLKKDVKRKRAFLADHFRHAQSDEEESQSSVDTSPQKYNSCPCLSECHQTGIWPQDDVRTPAVIPEYSQKRCSNVGFSLQLHIYETWEWCESLLTATTPLRGYTLH